jgi:hypothetical protein
LKFKGLIVELGEQKETVTDEDIKKWAEKDTGECSDPYVRHLVIIKKIEGAIAMRDGLIHASGEEQGKEETTKPFFKRKSDLKLFGTYLLDRMGETATEKDIDKIIEQYLD